MLANLPFAFQEGRLHFNGILSKRRSNDKQFFCITVLLDQIRHLKIHMIHKLGEKSANLKPSHFLSALKRQIFGSCYPCKIHLAC